MTLINTMIGKIKSEADCYSTAIDFPLKMIILIVKDEGVAERNTMKEGIRSRDGVQAHGNESGKPKVPPRFQNMPKNSQGQPFILFPFSPHKPSVRFRQQDSHQRWSNSSNHFESKNVEK